MRDDIRRRGFSRERHTALKLGLSGIALSGFGLAWLGFSSAHANGTDVAAPTQAPSATASGPASATTTSTLNEPAATSTRARTSRGS